jgi:hypothetical protein
LAGWEPGETEQWYKKHYLIYLTTHCQL